jgi:hypothetical protein
MSASRSELQTKIAAALDDVIREIVRDELEASRSAPDPEEWLPHTRWPVKSARVACQLARSGAIPARRAGKLWLARRRDLDAWVSAQPAARPPVAAAAAPTVETFDLTSTMQLVAQRRRRSA